MKRDRAPSERIRGISCFAKCVYTCQSRLESCNRTKPDLLVLACCAFPFASANIISVIQAKMYSKYIVATATGKRYVIRFWNIILSDSPQLRFTRCTPTPIPDFTLKWKTVSRCRSSLFPFVFLLVFFPRSFVNIQPKKSQLAAAIVCSKKRSRSITPVCLLSVFRVLF